MMKRFIKDNRGQVLYAVLVTIMFIGLLSMITMGLTLKNYQAAVNKQQHVSDYYAADAVAELIRIGEESVASGETKPIGDVQVQNANGQYTLTCGTVTIKTIIEDLEFKGWEVSYHADKTQADQQQPAE